jgi:hypothetical protein
VTDLVVFENPGEIDLAAVRTFGVSVKEGEHPIGFFGTGLKYALAILARTQHRIEIQSGVTSLAVSVRPTTIRGKEFQVVILGDEPMGFTTELGKTWEVWMAYRELHCNAADEAGHVYLADAPPLAEEGKTRVVVGGAPLLDAYRRHSEYILVGNRLWGGAYVDIHAGAGSAIFYRGVRVMATRKPTLYTYNVTTQLDLTEDRTAKNEWEPALWVALDVLIAQDREFIHNVLMAREDRWEHGLDFNRQTAPGAAFGEVVGELMRDRMARVNFSALKAYEKHVRSRMEPTAVELSGVHRKMLERAIAFCLRLDYAVEQYPIQVVDSMGEGILGLAKDGRIYLSRRCFEMVTKQVASTLIEEYVHLKYGYADLTLGMQSYLFDRLVSLGEQMQGEPL